MELSEIRDLSGEINKKRKREIDEKTLFAELIADIRFAVVRGVWVLGNLSSLPTGKEGPEIDFYIRENNREKRGSGGNVASPGALKILISQTVAQQKGNQ